MNKIIAFSMLVLALYALQTDQTHDQSKPTTVATTTTTTATTINNKPGTQTTGPNTLITPTTPRVQRQPHKEPGYQATAGNPFGRDPKGHLTCFQNPCFDPTGSCTVTLRPKTPVNRRKTNTRTNNRFTARTSVTTAAQTRQGTWKPIIYVVRVNGRKARFAGFRCV